MYLVKHSVVCCPTTHAYTRNWIATLTALMWPVATSLLNNVFTCWVLTSNISTAAMSKTVGSQAALVMVTLILE